MVQWRRTKVIRPVAQKKPGMAEIDLIDQTDIIYSASDGDFLTWVSTASAWIGVAPIPVGATATVTELSSIGDVVGDFTACNLMQYDGANWNPVDFTSIFDSSVIVHPSSVVNNITSIGDVEMSSAPEFGDQLEYDGSAWTNRPAYPDDEPTGFPNRSDSTIEFIDADRTFYICETNPGTPFTYYIEGQVFECSGASYQLGVASATEGMRLISFNSASLTECWPVSGDFYYERAFVGMLYWDQSGSAAVGVGEERHGIIMDGDTHKHIHEVWGASYIDGLALANFTVDGNGADNSQAQFAAEAGEIHDEDLDLDVSALSHPANIPVFYKDGANGDWKRKPANGYAFIWSDSATFTGGNDRLPYNAFSSGTWNLYECGQNKFVLTHIIANNALSGTRFMAIQGEVEYANAAAAREGAGDEIGNLTVAGFPVAEFVPVASVILKTNSTYANDINAIIVSTDEGDDYVDWRSAPITRGSGPGDHGSLGGLGDDDHAQYLNIDGRTAAQIVEGLVTFSGTVTFGEDIIVSGNIEQDPVRIGVCACAVGSGAISIGESSVASDEGIAIGRNAYAGGTQTIVIGVNASSTGDKAVVIGVDAYSSQNNTVAIGREAHVDGNLGIAIGYQAAAESTQTIAIGRSARAIDEDSIAIGYCAIADSGAAIAIGKGAKAEVFDSIAIGQATCAADNQNTLAVGKSTYARGLHGIALGASVQSSGNRAIAIGYAAKAPRDGAIAMGASTYASGTEALALGRDTLAYGYRSIAIGKCARVSGLEGLALGFGAYCRGNHSIAIGPHAHASQTGCIAIGHSAQAPKNFAIAIGLFARTDGTAAIAIGRVADAYNDYALAVGDNAAASGSNSIAIGRDAEAPGNDSIAIGYSACAAFSAAVAIGKCASVTEADQIVLGNSSHKVVAPGNMRADGGYLENISTVSACYSILDSDSTILINVTGGIEVPGASGRGGKVFTIKNIFTTATYISSTSNIDTSSCYTFGFTHQAIKIISDCASWWIIG